MLFHVYGEPASQTVVDSWGGATYLWHLMLSQMGYIVVSVDNRGTPAPRGRDWRKCDLRQDRAAERRGSGGGRAGDRAAGHSSIRSASASGDGAAVARRRST